ncbi:urah family protein [Megaselia abdita]
MSKRTISTHILNSCEGKAAGNVTVILFRKKPDNSWEEISSSKTNNDGRIENLITLENFRGGVYKLRFGISEYFATFHKKSLYPYIEITVECEEGQHYHVPLLLSPFSYSTYRGT